LVAKLQLTNVRPEDEKRPFCVQNLVQGRLFVRSLDQRPVQREEAQENLALEGKDLCLTRTNCMDLAALLNLKNKLNWFKQ
jgi:hypothetical protein